MVSFFAAELGGSSWPAAYVDLLVDTDQHRTGGRGCPAEAHIIHQQWTIR